MAYGGDGVVFDFVDADGAGAAESPDLARRYLHGPATDQVLAQEDVAGGSGSAADVDWLLPDHLGTIRDLVDSVGNLLTGGHLDYDSFGNAITGDASLTRYQFTGREWDPDAELYYYRARWYDPATGRFLSEDPLGLAPDSNTFRYTGNSPTNFIDPSGLSPLPTTGDEFPFDGENVPPPGPVPPAPTDGAPTGGTPSPDANKQLTQQEREELARALGFFGNRLKRRIAELIARIGEIRLEECRLNARLKSLNEVRDFFRDETYYRTLREVETELRILAEEKRKNLAEQEQAFEDLKDVIAGWEANDLDDVVIRLWDGADGLIVYSDVSGMDNLFEFEHLGWFYPNHTWTHGSLLMLEGAMSALGIPGVSSAVLKGLKSGRCLDKLDDVARATKTHRHHSIPKEIRKKLPPDVANHPDVRGRKGLPNVREVDADKHRKAHDKAGISRKDTGIGGGKYNQRFDEEIRRRGGYDKVKPHDITEIRDELMEEFGL